MTYLSFFFFSSRRRHTRWNCDWSSDVCSSDLPSEQPLRNPGLGLVGYAWEESGPSLAARAGRETLEQHVEKMSSLPFVDVLYIRCDWRNVQSRPGKLDLNPVWDLTFDAAKRKGLRVAFRVQLSNTSFQPEQLALPT